MKNQRFYLIIAAIVNFVLPHLRFHCSWQMRIGNGLLCFINLLGAKWTYEKISK